MTGLVAIDFETYLISEDMVVPKPVCLSYKFLNGKEGVLSGIDSMEAFLLDLLQSDSKVIAHNMSFEANVIDTWYPKLRGLLRSKFAKNQMICTKIYEQLLDNSRKKGLFRFDLATLVNNYFEEDISEDKKNPEAWRLRYHELDGVPIEEYPEEAYRYALDDSIWALKVYLEQRKTYVDINLSVKADYYLNKMGNKGLVTDQKKIKTLKQELLDILNPKYEKLIALGLCTRDKKGKAKKKMKNFREFLSLNIKNLEYTPKKTLSTSGESLERYALEEGPAQETINDFLVIAKYEKILTAFIARLEDNDTIRTQYNAVVSSGRTSSRTSPNYPSVNIQQMPRSVEGTSWDIRNCFSARPGYKLVSIDYNGLELASSGHQLSLLTSRDNMKRLINSGDKPVDMHSMFACKLKSIKDKRHVSYEEFVENKKKPGYKEFRQLAKPINLGFPGGIGYDNMRSILIKDGVTPELIVLSTATSEGALNFTRRYFRGKGYPVRIRRIGFAEFQLVKDELVQVKDNMFGLYPDLEEFLSEGHTKKLTGETKLMKDEFGEWQKEPMYRFEVAGFKRDWCMYTQVCNGLLMQSPAAIGAKKAMCSIIEKYADSDTCNPLAFIHDEIVFEVLDNDNKYDIIKDISKILIEEMQTVLTSVRIAVEAEICGDYWKKEGGEWSKTYWKNSSEDKLYED